MLRIFTIAPLLAAGLLRAQTADPFQPKIDAAIQAATAAKNPAALEKQAAEFESHNLYSPAQKLLTAALTLRAQVSGDQSADYGLCLLKLGALEHKLIQPKESADSYAQAVRLLPGRPETAQAFLYLGITALGKKDFTRATEYFQTAQNFDPALIGPVAMWKGLMSERRGEPEEAEAQYKSAVAVEDPVSTEAGETRTLYGRFLKEHGREAEAETAPVARPSPLPKLEAPKAATNVYRVGGGVTQPSVIFKTDPEYTEEARVAKVSGTVLLQLIVGVDGLATKVKVVRNPGFGLDDSAVATIAKWRFNPGTKDGAPVNVYATVEINFRLL